MPLRQLVVTALAICAAAGVVTAVADKGRDEPATAAGTRAVATTPVQSAARSHPAFHGRTVYVRMKRLAFGPRTIHLRVGDRVVWRNRDNVVHNVTTETDQTGANLIDLRSPDIGPRRAYAYVARHPGAAQYVCTIHPSVMHARIVVARRS